MLTAVGVLGLVAALILAAVFAAAGIAKLGDVDGTRTAVREFGAPEFLGMDERLSVALAKGLRDPETRSNVGEPQREPLSAVVMVLDCTSWCAIWLAIFQTETLPDPGQT